MKFAGIKISITFFQISVIVNDDHSHKEDYLNLEIEGNNIAANSSSIKQDKKPAPKMDRV